MLQTLLTFQRRCQDFSVAASALTGGAGAVKFVAVREVEELRRELEAALADATKARQEADAAVAAGIRKAIGNLRFAYRFEAGMTA